MDDLHARYAGRMRSTARSVTTPTSDVDDIVQEVFLLLWAKPDRFDPDRGSISTFLLMLTRRRCIDMIRSRAAQQRRDHNNHRARQHLAPLDATGDQIEASDVADRTRRLLSHLPTAQRRAIELAFFHCLTYREVATVLGVAEGTTKSRIRAGLRHLAELAAETAFERPATA